MRSQVEAVRSALTAGLAVARRARRDAFVPSSVTVAGWTAVYVGGRADLPPDAGAALAWTGLALVGLMAAPKLGALHRIAAGDDARDPLGRDGLQWSALEWRLAATATALAAGAAVLFAAIAGLAATAIAALSPLGRVELGRAGAFPAGLVLAAPALAAGAAGAVVVTGRFCVTLAADAAEPHARFARGWILTRGLGLASVAVWLITFAAPSAVVLVLPAALMGAGARPTAAAALAAGGALAALTQFLAAPVNAGALAQLRRAGREREAADGEQAVDTPGPVGDKARAPRPAAPSAEPLPT